MRHGRLNKVKSYNKAYNLASYRFQLNEEILIDANIWLYLFPPPQRPDNPIARSYSAAFANLFRTSAQPVLDPLVMSEYLNRYCRIEWNGRFQGRYSEYKDFRRSTEFRQVSVTARKYAQDILKMSRSHSLASDEMDRFYRRLWMCLRVGTWISTTRFCLKFVVIRK